MSSFLGAAASGGALVVLARNVPVSLATTAAQAICTPSQSFVPLYFTLRSGATAWSTTGSFAVGYTGALAAFVATVVATSLPTTVNFVSQVLGTEDASGSTAAPVIRAAGTVVYFSMVQIEPTATTSYVDLLGYIY